VQVLSRHGARDPTAANNKILEALWKRITKHGAYEADYAFLKDKPWSLGADQLTEFGHDQMRRSGAQTVARYPELAAKNAPFVRAVDKARIRDSAVSWLEGFNAAKAKHPDLHRRNPDLSPTVGAHGIVLMPQIGKKNKAPNPLHYGTCASFEASEGKCSRSVVKESAQKTFRGQQSLGKLVEKISKGLKGGFLEAGKTLTHEEQVKLAFSFMTLCSFDTVGPEKGTKLSHVCTLFTPDDWKEFDYYMDLFLHYSYGSGHPLGPSQGVGWTNELIARLTGAKVVDETSVNHAWDEDAKLFGPGHKIYADFSSDSMLTAIMHAMGLFEHHPLDPAKITARPKGSWSSSHATPFASRMYVERMTCTGTADAGKQFVRVVVNGEVKTLAGSSATDVQHGKYELSHFVSLLKKNLAGPTQHWKDNCNVCKEH
jgi:hypothetical protein